MIRASAVAVLLIALVGCGFQLRGEARLPELMARTAVLAADRNSPFVRELDQLLDANGIHVIRQPDPAAATLTVHAERMRREALTISGDARVREFVLLFEVEFSLRDPSGTVVIERETLRQSRDYSFDEQAILAASREEEFLREDLRRSMVGSVLRRLEAVGQANR